MPIIFTGLTVVALIALLVAERRGSRVGRYFTKPTASLGFIMVCASSSNLHEGYTLWILGGLLLGAGGDISLMFEGELPFLAGLGSFLLGHAAYVVAFALLLSPTTWIGPAMAAPIVGAIVVTRYLWPHLGSMKAPVIVYVSVITAMVIGALAIYLARDSAAAGNNRVLLLTAGAVAFFVSDIAVARERFVVQSFTNRAWGLPAYFGGQLLLAWSAVA